MSSIRIAIAALLIAREIHDRTSHQLVVLSRIHQPGLLAHGFQCQVVDYSNPSSLQHALMGVDTVISTVTGGAQLRLIEAAIRCQVRRFAPAEFEGQPGLRRPNDILDRGRSAALRLLQHYRGHIQSTVFVCGILFERFSINGMASHRIGASTGYGQEGDYIAHARYMTSFAPVWNHSQNLACLCLTSAHDVARFVVRSLNMPMWAPEMTMCGERMTVNTLVEIIRSCRNRPWARLDYLDPASLQAQLNIAQANGDTTMQWRLAPLLATAEGRYDFAAPAYLNTVYTDIVPTSFRDWFLANWASVP